MKKDADQEGPPHSRTWEGVRMDMDGTAREAPDDALIRNYLAGDPESFNILYERYRKPLFAYLNRLLGDHALADDLFQQTWIKAIRCFPKYRNQQRFFAWLSMIAHNLAMDQFRKAGQSPEMEMDGETEPEAAAPASFLPWKEMHDAELGKAIARAQGSLAPELREVFTLRCEGLSFKEIAEIQHCPLNTALGRMNYALKNLRKQLAEWM